MMHCALATQSSGQRPLLRHASRLSAACQRLGIGVLFLTVALAQSVHAEEVLEYRLKAAFLFNFMCSPSGPTKLATPSTSASAAPTRSAAVNLSPLQFRCDDLPGLVAKVLEETGLAPKLLELEVTEGALMENTSATRATLQTMHDLGIRIALDDFGTGYSSLAYLTRMPIGHLKIDKYFVAGLLEGGESKAIVRAVLAMAKSLGMQVTAEGVESLEQALLLKTLGCDYLQGFHFSGPIREPAIPAILSQHWPLELPPLLTIAQALVGQRTAETASPNPTYHNAVLTA
jgi:EAL domain-containing protein (putative c-di-GMP-specific phosphodiesterase class I)